MRIEDFHNEIDNLIKEGCSFAIRRVPGEQKLLFTQQVHGTVRTFSSIEELNGVNGFVIAPFHTSDTCPIVLINPDKEKEFDISDIRIDIKKDTFEHTEPSSDYSAKFNIFSEALQKKAFEKLVLSRHLTIERKPDFSPTEVFFKACKRYIRSYVYLCHTPETGTWIGSTPEILLAGTGTDWHTVALAGTRPIQNDTLPETWDEKNKKEQQLVSDYIKNRLHSFGVNPKEEGPYSVRAGELAHLKSDFRFSLPNNNRLGSLLNLLHPTPAVCGLPKDEAFRFISENEGYDRRYYSGFIGMLNPTSKSDLYVNLRCMEINKKTLTLYAGGGLLASSTLSEEWEETENKMSTMRRIVGGS
jgi:isochorismate synthase